MAGTLSLNGLVSGYDTQSIISALVGVASANLRNLQSDRSEYNTRLSLYQSFNGLVDDLKSAVTGLNEVNEITAYTASSSNESVFTASVTGDTFPGNYEIEVDKLAVAETTTSGGYAAANSAVSTGTLTITVGGGAAQTVTIDSSNDTLQGVAEAINDSVSGVHAYVVNTGIGGTPYKLMITSEDTGADNAFTIGAGTTGISFAETTAAQDAEFTVNGESLTSGSNTVTDVVPGLTLQLLGETGGSVETLTVSRDDEGIKSNIQSFVDAYNEVMEFINEQFEYTEADGSGLLSGDSTLRYIQRGLQQVISSTFNSGNDLQSLSSMGINTKADGSLEVDEGELSDALGDHYNDVIELFTSSSSLMTDLESTLDIYLDPASGTLETKTDSLEEIISVLEEKIDDERDRIDKLEERLINQFSNMEAMLSRFKSTEQYLTALYDAQFNKK